MLLMTTTNMSHTQYKVFLETMQFATMDAIHSLPSSLATLREHCRRNMPLMKIREQHLPVTLRSLPPKKTTPAKTYRFEIEEYAKLWLANTRIATRMHFGLGILEDNGQASNSEFYNGDSWLGSIRTTSGEFAILPEDTEPLLPSDCISTTNPELPILQIQGIGRSSRTGTVNLLCKRLLPPDLIPLEWRLNWSGLCSIADEFAAESAVPRYELTPSTLPELVLMEDDRIILPISAAIGKLWIHFLDHTDQVKLSAGLLPQPPTFCVRRLAYSANNKVHVRSIHQRHRIPAENELMQLGRQYCIKRFLANQPSSLFGGRRRVSIPFSIFLDDFGLYRNAYHSLGGLYLQPANLDQASRFTLQNMFVLMLIPFGGNQSNIAACLADETIPLHRGMETILHSGEELILTVFPLCVTGDMPQQNANSGVMSHKSTRGCHYCFKKTADRGLLLDDVLRIGRYQQPHNLLFAPLTQQAVNHSKKTSHDISLSMELRQPVISSIPAFLCWIHSLPIQTTRCMPSFALQSTTIKS